MRTGKEAAYKMYKGLAMSDAIDRFINYMESKAPERLKEIDPELYASMEEVLKFIKENK